MIRLLGALLGRRELPLIGGFQFLLLLRGLLFLAAKLSLDRLQIVLQRLSLLLRQTLAVGKKLLVSRFRLLKLLAVLGLLLAPLGGDRIVELLLLLGRESLRGFHFLATDRSRFRAAAASSSPS